MAYIAPTVEEFRVLYPEFVNADDDEVVEATLNLAIEEVGTSWIESDRKRAQLALTAFYLARGLNTTLGSGGGAGVETGAIKRKTVGPVSIMYETGGDSATAAATDGTSKNSADVYWEEYNRLMRRSFPAVAIV